MKHIDVYGKSSRRIKEKSKPSSEVTSDTIITDENEKICETDQSLESRLLSIANS